MYHLVWMDDHTVSVLSGALGLAVILFLYKLFSAFQYPDLNYIEHIATKPIPNKGDDSKVTIFGFFKSGQYYALQRGVAEPSPFVTRVEYFCRLYHIPYEKEAALLTENPRHKVPFVNLQGVMIDDSSRIIAALEKQFNIQEQLSNDAMAQATFIRRLLFDSLYWVLMHFMFETKRGREVYISMEKKLLPPFPLNELILAMIFRQSRTLVHSQGIGRRPHEDIVEIGKADLKALSISLGESKFFLGRVSPSSLDCDVYSMLSGLFYDDHFKDADWIKETKRDLPNMITFVKRMKTILFPELTGIKTVYSVDDSAASDQDTKKSQ